MILGKGGQSVGWDWNGDGMEMRKGGKGIVMCTRRIGRMEWKRVYGRWV